MARRSSGGSPGDAPIKAKRANGRSPTARGEGSGVAPPPEEYYRPVGFWQQQWVQDVLPFVTSLTLHAVVIVVRKLFPLAKSAMASPSLTTAPDSNAIRES